jgi:hypothetical protein
MSFTPEEIEAGQAIYTKRMLGYYDLRVLWVSNPLIWKCPTSRLLNHYNRFVTANHLDVGVGSGYYLDKCHFPTPTPRILLMDLNANSLAFAAERIERYHPEILLRNVLEPVSFDGPGFDSIGVNYLLHCLPGKMAAKCCIFDNLRPLMAPGAVIFGSTLLQRGVERSIAARALMAYYNFYGVFSNTSDSLATLRQELELRFRTVSIEIVGCVALFSARI